MKQNQLYNILSIVLTYEIKTCGPVHIAFKSFSVENTELSPLKLSKVLVLL